MDISALAFGQALNSGSAPPAPPEASSGFTQALDAAQSGAPPGNGPPPTGKKVGEEVAIMEPNAPTQNPDFLPTLTPEDKTAAQTGLPSVPEIVARFALVAPAIFPVPQVSSAPGSTGSGTSAPTISSSLPTVSNDVPITRTPDVTIATDAATIRIQPTVRGPVAGEVDAALRSATEHEPSGSTDQAKVTSKPTANSHIPTVSSPDSAVNPPKGAPVPSSAHPTRSSADSLNKPTSQSGVIHAPTSASGPASDGESADDSSTPHERSETLAPVVKDPNVDGFSVKLGLDKPATHSLDHEIRPELQTDSQPIRPKQVNLIVRQIADRMELLAATRPKSGVTIQLNPAHLGTITMTVKSVAGGIDAHIAASDDGVRAALEQNRPLLGSAMEQRGLKLDNVSIAPQTQTSTQSEPQKQQAQSQHRHPQSTPTQQTPTHGIADPVTARSTVRKASGVDLWI